MIDYTIPPFSFSVGDIDVTDYMASFTISSPHLEINNSAEWSGDFQLDYNLVARRRGLSEADFDPLGTPLRWRSGLASVSIQINGYQLPIMRIASYAYNPQTKIGQGRLVQILSLLSSRESPSSEPDIQIQTGKPIVDVVRSLLNHAFVGTPLTPTITLNTAGMTGDIFSPIVTRKPAQDAQKLCGISWRWLTIGLSEEVQLFNGTPSSSSVLFSRSLNQVEWTPDIDNINFAAPKVIITGSCQIPDLIACPAEPNGAADDKGRPKKIVTESFMPYGQVFPGSGGSTQPTLASRKTIVYGYNKDDTGISTAPWNLPFEVGGDLNTATIFNTKDYDANTPIKTLTVIEEPAGKIIPSLGQDGTIRVASATVETPFIRSVYVPIGTIFPALGANFNLTASPREILTGERVSLKPTHGGSIDPATGKPTCYEATPILEEVQPIAQNPLKTIVIRGEALVVAPNWTPLNPVPYIDEVGFLPSEIHANILAQNIALREQYRRDAVQLTLPIPIEWLAAACPPGLRILCHDAEFWCDAIIISFQDNEAKFSCSAGRMAKLTNIIQPPLTIAPYVPTGLPQVLTPGSASGTIGVPFSMPILIGGL